MSEEEERQEEALKSLATELGLNFYVREGEHDSVLITAPSYSRTNVPPEKPFSQLT